MNGIDTLVVDAAILSSQADDGENDGEAASLCTTWTVDPTTVTCCAMYSDSTAFVTSFGEMLALIFVGDRKVCRESSEFCNFMFIVVCYGSYVLHCSYLVYP